MKIQRRAILFICGNYNIEDNYVTKKRQEIGLPSLEERRKHSRLIMMYKVVNHHTAIPLPDYIRQRARVTRNQQQHRIQRLSLTSNSYKFSFFPRTLKDWDDLPRHIIELAILEQFKEAIIAE